ncbi:MarP family serine protease [Acidiferrimicrobium sp. IK]|uniref:MarP family serine protease n=1 Tax=Acidiferrimicrobium sp. IK TaxID=2871700 RepID=UPI0021CB026E|nr:MarP family serine protease [Acidiferrimicrobium sp. IK]MCU4184656.1 MarP family serine protease [Acidiferrimicrobium sp. IK]
MPAGPAPMNGLDVLIIVIAAAAAVGGFRMGFLARALSWAGLAAGLYVGARLVPTVAAHMSLASSTSRLLVAMAVLIGPALIGLAVGASLGASLSRALPLGPLRLVDRGIGALVGILGVLVVLWLLLPALGSVQGLPARASRQSAISRWVDGSFPAAPNTVERLRQLVGNLTGPTVFNGLHQAENTGPPPAAVPLSPATVSAVTASTVKVEGQACNRIQDGSGFTVAPHLVVTNAHVVAGEPAGETSVITPSGSTLPATVVRFDPNRDLALLSVPGLAEAPLSIATGTVGEQGAVFGHPGGQTALQVIPAAISQEVTAVGEDLYNTHSTRRDVFILAAYLMPGDSGGALVSTAGKVIGVAFAIAPDRPGTSYALASSELQAVLASPTTGAVSTQSCLAG